MLKVLVIHVFLFQLFLFKYVLTVKSLTVQAHKRNAGFLFSLPKTLITGKNETVCVSLHQAELPSKILVDLKWKEKHFTTSKTLDSEHTCFQMYVPVIKILDPQFVNVRVQVQINGEIQSAHNQDPILMYVNKQTKIFIETDRGIYKPGDTVKFRILILNENFLPVSTKVSEIRINNPMGITSNLWDNVNTDHGLISLEYQMVTEAMTGKWKIEVEHQTKIFEVSKYTVPRFKIELKYPKVFYYKNDCMVITVCAKYSYNKPVAGLAFIKISDSHNNMKPGNKLEYMSNGCSNFKIENSELNLETIPEKFRYYDPKINIFVTATVTENGTNKMDVATGKTVVSLKGYNMKFRSSPLFIPGLPYKGQLKISNNITNISREIIEICYNIAIKKSWNYFNNEQCSNYTIQDEGIVRFKLWPFKSNVLHVHLHARSINNSLIGDSFLVVRMYSPSNSYIHLEKDINNSQMCNTHYQYKILYTTDHFKEENNITFFSMVKTNTGIFKLRKMVHAVRKTMPNHSSDEKDYLGEKHKYVKLGTSFDEFFLKFRIDQKFLSKIQLLVYYVTNDGETVSVTKSDEIEPCTLKVESSWAQNQLVPGEIATLNVKSESPALCAVSATDKASKFITGNNQNLNLERIQKILLQERESAQSGRNTCIVPNKKSQGEIASKLTWDLRRKRHVYSFAEDYDSYDIFSRFGIITITNLKVVTKLCYNGPLLNDSLQVQFLTDQYDSDNEDSSHITIRSFFPENWLWELVPVNNSVQLQRELPHSITNWVTNVFCVSKTDGIGFSPETEISSFQPFFVDVLTPYSLKKGEYYDLQIHVFNYLNYSFPIRISIRLSSNLELASTHLLSAAYCLSQNSTITHTYPLIALEMGLANITVLVETENQYPLSCGPETIMSKRDVVYKSIKIDPEGYSVTKTKSALLCALSNMSLENNVTWGLVLPNDIVPGTERILVTINTDLLGRTIENLNQLLVIPAGCGEQIMASMAPNVYILRYLKTIGRLTPTIKQRIIRNLKMGYQRILNYVHTDGSFSAFGYYDLSGSMFLTAFVVKVLQEAKNLVYVDQRVIDKAVNWIFSHQLENGCFDTMDHVFQDMGGTNMENSTAGLTSYVISSLFDANINVPDTVQTNAKYCIRSQHNADKYSLIISSYALFKINWISEGNRFLEKAIAIASRENDLMWWGTKGDEYYASDIEITSYALLTLLQQRTAKYMAYAHSIVRWLTSKIGPTGAFKSTQDTVVALEALTTYLKLVQVDTLDLRINLEAHQERHMFSVEENDRLKSKQVVLQSKNTEVKMYVNGTGCALAQLTVSYFTKNVSKSEAFKLAVEVASVSNVDECSIKSISPCVAYEGPEKHSNMAVMEISLPSGYEADRSSLYEILETGQHKNIKRFEEEENQINFYFTRLDNHQVCFSFKINENSPLENRKESLVKLYDYYRPEQNILQFYKLMNNCSNVTIDNIEGKAHSIMSSSLSSKSTQGNKQSLEYPSESTTEEAGSATGYLSNLPKDTV